MQGTGRPVIVGSRQVSELIGFMALAGVLVARPVSAQDWTVAPPPEGEVQASFDDTLSPYGDWVDVNGTRAWRPSASVVGEDFQPYATNGQWLYSDSGWYFQSDYPWGWAPFHYGRWALDPNYGWIWVPGDVWAPAWVDWRMGGGYVGWAPLPPIGWSVVVQPWRPYWCFVPGPYFAAPNFWAYRVPVERVHYAYAATAPVHEVVVNQNSRWYRGPGLANVERVSSQPVARVAGTLVPPAPGRVQPVTLQPPRGTAPRTPAVNRAPAGGGSHPAPHPVPHSTPPPVHVPRPPSPHGSYFPASPPSHPERVGAPHASFAAPHGSSARSAPVAHPSSRAAHSGRFR
jgi:hypothetical protein